MSKKETIKQRKKGDRDFKMTPVAEMFCRIYVMSKEFRNKGVRSYAVAAAIDLSKYDEMHTGGYDRKSEEYKIEHRKYQSCLKGAEGLLNEEKVQARITQIINSYMSETVVDAELGKVIVQDDDLGNKVQGIREYNKLHGRIIDKREINGTFSLSELLKKVDE